MFVFLREILNIEKEPNICEILNKELILFLAPKFKNQITDFK